LAWLGIKRYCQAHLRIGIFCIEAINHLCFRAKRNFLIVKSLKAKQDIGERNDPGARRHNS
jgi:hypothetical protein